jgi:hypothetical protein
VAIKLEEEKNCCVDGPIIVLLTIIGLRIKLQFSYTQEFIFFNHLHEFQSLRKDSVTVSLKVFFKKTGQPERHRDFYVSPKTVNLLQR